MAVREFACDLGGERRVFKYTNAERDLLEDRFDDGLYEILYRKALSTDPATGKITGVGRRKVIVAVIWAGLKYYGKGVTERRVSEWLEQLVDEKPQTGVMEPLMAAVGCIWASGLMGVIPEGIFDFEAPKDDQPETESGKDDAA
jgi:hypothetical protein